MVSLPSISSTGISKFPLGAISGISVSSYSSSASNPGNSTSTSYGWAPTPRVYTSTMRRPYLSVKVRSFGWYLPNVLTRAITMSGIGIKSQFLRTSFLPEFNAMNSYPSWRFPLGLRQTPHFVLVLYIAWDLILMHLAVMYQL